MGLDAVVYKNKQHLTFDAEREGALLDNHTGEVYFEDEALSKKYPRDAFRAIHKRLGNLQTVVTLREELRKLLGHDDTFLQKRWLYSAFHSGDIIGAKDFDALERDLSVVKQATEGKRSERLDVFLRDVGELIAVARREGNRSFLRRGVLRAASLFWAGSRRGATS